MWVLHSRAPRFVPVVLLTSFRNRLAFPDEGCAWWEFRGVPRLHAGLALCSVQRKLRGAEDPEVSIPCTLGIKSALPIPEVQQVTKDHQEAAAATSAMTHVGTAVLLNQRFRCSAIVGRQRDVLFALLKGKHRLVCWTLSFPPASPSAA